MKNTCEKDAVLGIDRKNLVLVPIPTIELGDLNRRYSKGRPARPSKANSTVAPRFVNK